MEIEWFVDSIANDVKYSVKLLIKLMIIAIISLSIPSFVGGVDGDYVRGIVWVVGRVDDGNRLLIYLAKATTWVRILLLSLIIRNNL